MAKKTPLSAIEREIQKHKRAIVKDDATLTWLRTEYVAHTKQIDARIKGHEDIISALKKASKESKV